LFEINIDSFRWQKGLPEALCNKLSV